MRPLLFDLGMERSGQESRALLMCADQEARVSCRLQPGRDSRYWSWFIEVGQSMPSGCGS